MSTTDATGRALPAPSTTSSPARVGWADTAKGLCIVLVVLHHVVGKHLPVLTGSVPWVQRAWDGLDAAFDPVRMPLFFLISGTFAASALTRPWSRTWRDRLLRPYWVYLVWLPVHALVFTVVATRIETHRSEDLLHLVRNAVVASTGLWYLFALAAYFLLARVTRRLPVGVVVPAAAAVSLSSSWLPLESANEFSLVRCVVFFVVGARLPDLLSRLGRLGRRDVALAGAAYVVLGLAVLTWPPTKSVTTLLLAPAAVALGVAVSRVLDRSRHGAAAARLGRATLPVYVMHMPLLGLLHQVATSASATTLVADAAAAVGPLVWATVVLAYPLTLSGALVTLSLLAQRGLRRVGCRWLFEPPLRRRP